MTTISRQGEHQTAFVTQGRRFFGQHKTEQLSIWKRDRERESERARKTQSFSSAKKKNLKRRAQSRHSR